MNLKNRINNFINSESNYHVGFAIFLECSTNPNLVRTLARGESVRNFETLKYELQKIAKTLPNEVESDAEPMQQSESIVPIFPIQPTIATAGNLIKTFSDEQRELYRSRGHFHGQLHAAQTNAERLEIMLKLDTIQRKIDISHGHVEDIKAGKIDTSILKKQVSAEDILRIRNLKMYIARDQKKLNTIPKNEKQKRQVLDEKIQQWQNELNEKSWNQTNS